MPNQVEPGTIGDAPVVSDGTVVSGEALGGTGPASAGQQAHAPTGEHAAFHGRKVSWVAVVTMMVGFLVGGLALVFGNWPIFWVGGGLVVIGGLLAMTTDIFEDWY